MSDLVQNVTTIEVEELNTVLDVLESVSVIEVLRDSNIFINGGDGGFYYPFSWGDATPATVFSLPAGKILASIILKINTPFDSPSIIEIGINGDLDLFMPSAANAPQVQGIYTVSPYYRNTASTDVILSIVPGGNNSTGSGFIFLQLG
jgi:hypothetical protein